jgi:NitT/TauT family transport system permease protein
MRRAAASWQRDSTPLEVLVAPFIAAGQAFPVVAVAPIIILLLGADLRPKVLIGAVVVFPLLITAVTGAH